MKQGILEVVSNGEPEEPSPFIQSDEIQNIKRQARLDLRHILGLDEEPKEEDHE